MGLGGSAPPAVSSTPVGAATVEVVHDSEHTRVSRVFLSAGSVIHKQPFGPDRQRRLRHEQTILERLAGVPGVAQLAEAPAWPGRAETPAGPGSIVLVDVRGEPLTRTPTPLDGADLWDLAWGLARAVAAMHARGVVHRDIAPANILITAEGTPCLIDFAFATTSADLRPEFTHHNETVGTLPYLAPEQTGRTGRPVDHRVDLYALGATLYELATGSPPFGTGDPLRLIHDHLTVVPAPPDKINLAVDGALSDIIMHLLEKEPDDRYQTAEGLVNDLVRLRDERIGTKPRQVGARDRPLRPLPPSRLVGRHREIAALGTAFAHARSGRHRGVLVSGAAGVGKTSLVNELRAIATAHDGWYVSGAFDRFRRDQEFDAVWQAFRHLGRLLLAEPEEQLADLRRRLEHVLDGDARLIATLHPEFATALRVPPSPTIGDPATLSARLSRAGTEILRAVAASGRPVVIAVDDVQWAGRSPMDFLDRVLTERSLDGVLLVATYRTGDSAVTGPPAATLADWGDLPGIAHLALTNLTTDDLAVLLADMLGMDVGSSSDLAAFLAPHTGGNPYETVELLRSLSHEGLLEPSPTGWTWDPARLRKRLDHADVAELLASRAAATPPATRELLQAMACLGGRAELSLLQAATGRCASEVADGLQPALAGGLLVSEPGPAESVRFRHDRVQQAILSKLSAPQRHAARLDLARRLAGHHELFAVAAEQYLPVVDAVRLPEERRRVVSLLRRAAEQARLLGNHLLVQQCLAAATRLTDPADTDALVALHSGHHEALYHLGELVEADQVFTELDRLCRDPRQRVEATLTQISSLTNRNRFAEAIWLGLELLQRLGFAAPPPDRLNAEVKRDLDDLYRWVTESGGSCDLDRPEITDPTLLTVGAVINRLVPPAFFSEQPLMAWLSLQACRIWREHGPGRTLVGPVSHLAYVTTGRLQDFRTAHNAIRRALAASQAYGYELETAQAQFLYALSGWRIEPLEDCVGLARRAREGLTNGGEVQYACYSYYVTTACLFDIVPLESYASELEAGLTCARNIGSDQVTQVLEVYRRLVDVLRGGTPHLSISDIGIPERYRANRPALAGLHVARALAAALFGDSAELAAQTEAMLPLLSALEGTYMAATARVLRALALAEQARAGPVSERDAVVAELDHLVDWVAARSADAPANFLHLLRLLEAERARAVGDFRTAVGAFDAAMREAATSQRPWHRALILEHAARFCLAHGLDHSGRALMADARHAYLVWGATAKVEQLDWAFPTMQDTLAARPETGQDPVAAGPTSRSHLMPGAVDLFSILAASQALSSETSVNGLRERVADVLCTMTGATGVHLLLWNDDQDAWLLTVPGEGDGATVPLEEAGTRGLVPVSAVRYAERTSEPLVVSDATRDDRFRRDPYLAGLERCSLLAVPIRSGGAVPALLVLENRLISSAFTSDRLDGVILIAGQLAVSLNNTMVYASLERMVAERTEELADANARLERLSVTDALTGLANRRRLEKVLGAEWGRARRAGMPIAMAMVDIDHFKDYNDQYGHVAGDRCLQRVAALLRSELRDADLVARYGGEEFAIVMPGTDLDAAVAAAERLRAAVVALAEPHPRVADQVVTVTIGVAATVPQGRRRVGYLAEQADAQLYRAKRAGRNRVLPAMPLAGDHELHRIRA